MPATIVTAFAARPIAAIRQDRGNAAIDLFLNRE